MEEQLAQYRKRKKREKEYAALKQKIWDYFAAVFSFWRPAADAAEDVGPSTYTAPGSPAEGETQGDTSRPATNVSA